MGTLPLEVCTFVSFKCYFKNVYNNFYSKNISVPRIYTGQKHFQIFSKVYVFLFIFRKKLTLKNGNKGACYLDYCDHAFTVYCLCELSNLPWVFHKILISALRTRYLRYHKADFPLTWKSSHLILEFDRGSFPETWGGQNILFPSNSFQVLEFFEMFANEWLKAKNPE